MISLSFSLSLSLTHTHQMVTFQVPLLGATVRTVAYMQPEIEQPPNGNGDPWAQRGEMMRGSREKMKGERRSSVQHPFASKRCVRVTEARGAVYVMGVML